MSEDEQPEVGDSVPIKLHLAHNSSFSVLIDKMSVETCYTDGSGTSRSSDCSPNAFITFCSKVLARFAKS